MATAGLVRGMGTKAIWGWWHALGRICGGHMLRSLKLTGPCLGRLSYSCQVPHSLPSGAGVCSGGGTSPDPSWATAEVGASGECVARKMDSRWTGSEETDIN